MKPELKLPFPTLKGLESIWRGWVRPVEGALDQLEAEVEGLKLRLRRPVDLGEPGCYREVKVFSPESLVVARNVGAGENVLNTNYIVRSGKQYDVTVIMPGPGVFVAEYVRIHLYQRLFRPGIGAQWTQMAPAATTSPGQVAADLPQRLSILGTTGNSAGYNSFLWNITDHRSGRVLASDYMSNMVLQPRMQGPRVAASVFALPLTTNNGNWFRFQTPWLVERDGQLTLNYFPTTDIAQLTADQAGGFSFDDREGDTRNQSVALTVEFHGYRYKTDQDAIRAGALVHDSY